MTTQQEAIKLAFENWYGENYSTYALKTWIECDRMYDNLDTDLAYRAWLAALDAVKEPEPVYWTDKAILSLLNREGDGPYGEQDILDTRKFLEHSEQLRTELTAPPMQKEPEPRVYMFNVLIEGKASAVFDTADEAVRYAMHHCYLVPAEFQVAVDTLNQGQVFQYSYYGFNEAIIVPVAKRRTAPPSEVK